MKHKEDFSKDPTLWPSTELTRAQISYFEEAEEDTGVTHVRMLGSEKPEDPLETYTDCLCLNYFTLRLLLIESTYSYNETEVRWQT